MRLGVGGRGNVGDGVEPGYRAAGMANSLTKPCHGFVGAAAGVNGLSI